MHYKGTNWGVFLPLNSFYISNRRSKDQLTVLSFMPLAVGTTRTLRIRQLIMLVFNLVCTLQTRQLGESEEAEKTSSAVTYKKVNQFRME